MLERIVAAAAVTACLCFAAARAADEAPQSYSAATAGLEEKDGLLPVFLDSAKGRILLSLPAPDKDGVSARYLYLTALRTGLGSAPVGLDRGLEGDTQVLDFRRVGDHVVAEYENLRFRGQSSPAEDEATRQSFATSIVWAGKILAVSGDGRLLVDISDFLTRDVLDAADRLKEEGGKAGFKLDKDLSLADVAATKVFPDNLEFEARETFASDTPGPEVRNIAPDPKLVTLIVHHSLVKLPGPGYEPRRFDPRAGGFSVLVADYSTPLGQPIVYRLAERHRLEKINPGPAPSRVKNPIVYYVDRSAPKQIRDALIEGASWWSKAFAAAGYIDAFQVKEMPEGMDPLDVRYNVINWVDRATRGWSFGQSVVDPRTGEIVKGSVILGSLRVRQDMLIFESLMGADKDNTGGPDDPVQVALARLRQLAAHEVGHTLGFSHNFAGSSQDRASVMDYPAPRILLKNGKLDLSDAYGVGVGKWDMFTVDWLYGEDPPGAAGEAERNAKVEAMLKSGMRYVTDEDARPLGAAQPWASLWDDGPDPAAELARLMKVRRAAIDEFGLEALEPGEPVADLKRKYVPIYLLHRYQIDAAAKLVGGVDYRYTVNGDTDPGAKPVPQAQQREALNALLETLSPAELDTPERLIPLLSAAPTGESDRQYEIEVLPTFGPAVFDPLVAADVAAGLTIDALIAPERLARLADAKRRDAKVLGAHDVLDALTAKVFAPPASPRLAAIANREQTRLTLDIAREARAKTTPPDVAADLSAELSAISARLKTGGGDAATRAHKAWLAHLLANDSELDKALAEPERTPDVPPGMPIGAEE
ncbi:MAG: zinc-dependent metalloprotease [Alphaproteobacteria bacterium]|nr:zinc-dependent metalloprotease [Alphaproteobacteria bacterium]